MLKHLDLFSGIGGFALATRMVGGIETRQFVEIDSYCQRVLSKNFPKVPIHGDITTFVAERGEYDIITGGFPCQDISQAGKGAGLKGKRSGLFFEIIRIAGLVRPRFIVLENVAALISRGFAEVLGALTKAGYDTEWAVISAKDVGACHLRKRVWIIAYPNSFQCLQRQWLPTRSQRKDTPNSVRCFRCGVLTHPNQQRRQRSTAQSQQARRRLAKREVIANTNSTGLEERQPQSNGQSQVRTPDRSHCCDLSGEIGQVKSKFCGDDDGISRWVDRPYLMPPEHVQNWLPSAVDTAKQPRRRQRLKALGNAVVPHVAVIPLMRVLEMNKLFTGEPK